MWSSVHFARLIFISLILTLAESTDFVKSGSVQNLDEFYNLYGEIHTKTNVSVQIFRTTANYECCISIGKTYCASYNLMVTICCKNMDNIDIKCPDIERIEYTIYYLVDEVVPSAASSSSGSEYIGPGAIIGIAVAAILFVSAASIICYMLFKYRKTKNDQIETN